MRLFRPSLLVLGAALAFALACRDVSRFSSKGDHYEGDIVKGNFVRSGLAEDAKLCLVLDAEHLQDGPGSVTSSDGRFRATPLRPIPQVWHDPLSTLSFGDGRRQNLVYVATPNADGGEAGGGADIMIILSLMTEGGVEIRMMRGAPQTDSGTPAATTTPPLFGVFTLDRREGSCSF
ncbi:hypothetical protein BH11MYX4_BH11MYX4_52620 [soil metagenome]